MMLSGVWGPDEEELRLLSDALSNSKPPPLFYNYSFGTTQTNKH
jgi:hypothetical protein